MKDSRKIALPLACAVLTGLAVAPASMGFAGERQRDSKKTTASKDSARRAAKAAREAAFNGKLNNLHRVSRPQSEGGIAGATTDLATCFEAPDYTLGNLDTQQGWFSFPAASSAAQVTAGSIDSGAQVVVLSQSGGIPGTDTGAGLPLAASPAAPGRYTMKFKVSISGTGGADYFADAVSYADGFITARIDFHWTDAATNGDPDTIPSDVRIIDEVPPGGPLAYRSTGLNWVAGAEYEFTMDIDNDAGTVKYYVDDLNLPGGPVFFASGVSLWDATGVDGVQILSDDFQNPGETGTFDCISIESAVGLCAADIFRNNAVDTDDLLAMLGSWGPCANPADCSADIAAAFGAVDTDDLLALLGSWGPCDTPTGGCCNGGSCAVSTFAACIGAGGAYQGNSTDPNPCAPVVCPAANDACSSPQVITPTPGSPFTQSVTVADYTASDATDPDTACEIAGGGPFIKIGGWWYSYTAPASGVSSLTVATCSTALDNDAVVSAYTGACGTAPGAGWTMVQCDDDTCNSPVISDPDFGSATMTFAVTPGTTYRIFIDNYSGGDFQPTVDVTITANP